MNWPGRLELYKLASQLDSNFMSFIGLIAFISISLGIINMFPLPALDGGHFLLLIIESIRKKPLNKKVKAIKKRTTSKQKKVNIKVEKLEPKDIKTGWWDQ